MKKLFYLPLVFGVILLSSGCELLQQEEFDLVDPNPVTLPDPAANFIQANYPEHQLRHLDNEDLCDNTRVIKVELEDGPAADIDLYFTPSGTYLFSATELPVEALPPAVLAVINSSYADYTIDAGKVERYDFPDGSLQYKVELVANNGDDYDLVVTEDGTLVCWEKDYPDDDDDDDDRDDNGSGSNSDSTNVMLPDSIRSFISSQYPGYQIDHAEREDLCDDTYYLKVELEDGPGPDIDLYFNLDWMYSFAAIDIADSDIPSTVSSSLTIDFPGYSVVSSKTQRLEFPNGNIEYYLRLSAPAARDQKVIYDASGNLKCVDQRDDDDDDNDDNDDDDDNDGNGGSFTLPDSIRTFISANYGGYNLGQPEREDRCNDQYFIKIELEDGPGRDVDLYFSLDWVFSFSATEVAVSELPVAVTAALENDFPGATFDDAPEQLRLPDNTIQYYLEVETAEDNYDLLYAEDGILLCNDRS